ncbi:30S ribosomal protein S20 [Candidatus Falkowbacteria bacterium CG_4_10_14_0_2_um_filter_41_15]|uniref:Small ribosomal subunit protein bS20 n=1 Tax=Candidatus Falkowbacteria bacterium CG_4_10_14_0_2_um_filter_41_15 TaxID=1974554 RepID=A0A2M7VYG6_9BACT|nr:MAG: 30S ribosomal protein S20 [Candidatus Falkowbacteria bacterium CG_4_10_14_0_2_um_filter_41_15]
MPNQRAAKKDLRKNVKRKKINNSIKANTKKLVKDIIKNIESKEIKAKVGINSAIQAIDKMVKKGIIKANTASRQKSKLQKKANKSK